MKMTPEQSLRRIQYKSKQVDLRKILLFEQPNPSGIQKYTLIEESSSFKGIGMWTYFICPKYLVEFTIGTEANKAAPASLKEKIMKDEDSVPAILRELTDSFECTPELVTKKDPEKTKPKK